MPTDPLIDALHRADLADDVLLRIAHCYANDADDLYERTTRMLAVIGPRVAAAAGDHARVQSLLAEVVWVAS